MGGLHSVDSRGRGIDQVGGGVSDGKVPKPVGGSGQRHTLSSDGKREDLSNDDPSDRSPSGSEGGDVLSKEETG